MKRHLVIVGGVVYPEPSPTGLCSMRYASLLDEDYDVEFIAISNNGKEEYVTYDGVPVHTLICKRLSIEYKTTGTLKKLIHLYGSSLLRTSIMGNLGWYSKAAYKELESIHNVRPIDVILTVCSPFSAHIAGAKFKKAHPEVRFNAYTVDPFATSNRIIPLFRKFGDLVTLERNISSQADCLFLSEEAIASRQDLYGDIMQKMALPYLLPEVNDAEGGVFDDEHIHCVYAGSFYRNIRNPEYMLKVFSMLNNKKIILHLYSAGCDDLIQEYASMCDQIQFHGYVSQVELQQVYASCDFLIGVGNSMNDFLPSKTYEYLAQMRPVVFFNSKGYENKVLENYPHSLQLFDDVDVSESVRKLGDFISREEGMTISKVELSSLYEKNTPDYVREVLINGLQGN